MDGLHARDCPESPDLRPCWVARRSRHAARRPRFHADRAGSRSARVVAGARASARHLGQVPRSGARGSRRILLDRRLYRVPRRRSRRHHAVRTRGHGGALPQHAAHGSDPGPREAAGPDLRARWRQAAPSRRRVVRADGGRWANQAHHLRQTARGSHGRAPSADAHGPEPLRPARLAVEDQACRDLRPDVPGYSFAESAPKLVQQQGH